ncbi:hypothetical protein ANCCEY_03034 [Ancylostoma ceylanicum]|uniref:Uncharacterized protein n=1 Tax=Ancylostoma ceylanicum TaxID=53326 RepID=A0A0D6M305_9BILA|nr:hypothetical protein ANCCEY_03034 [Ancylostoma ceylanicum]
MYNKSTPEFKPFYRLDFENQDSLLFSIVARDMVRCGATNPQAHSTVNVVCSKRHPKDYRETTAVDGDGYPRYRRPSDGRSVEIEVSIQFGYGLQAAGPSTGFSDGCVPTGEERETL